MKSVTSVMCVILIADIAWAFRELPAIIAAVTSGKMGSWSRAGSVGEGRSMRLKSTFSIIS